MGTDWIRNNIRFVPLYEAKMGDFYDHRASRYGARGDERGKESLLKQPTPNIRIEALSRNLSMLGLAAKR